MSGHCYEESDFVTADMGIPSLLLLCWLMSVCECNVKLIIKLVQFENRFHKRADGQLCDGPTDDCDTVTRACVDLANSLADPSDCRLLSKKFVGPMNDDIFTYDVVSASTPFVNNPSLIMVSGWPQRKLLLKFTVHDRDSAGREEPIDTYRLLYAPDAAAIDSQSLQLTAFTLDGERPLALSRDISRLSVELGLYCADGSNGRFCNVSCFEQDQCNGHFTCNRTTGQKICLPGWQGSRCKVPVDVERCTKYNGLGVSTWALEHKCQDNGQKITTTLETTYWSKEFLTGYMSTDGRQKSVVIAPKDGQYVGKNVEASDAINFNMRVNSDGTVAGTLSTGLDCVNRSYTGVKTKDGAECINGGTCFRYGERYGDFVCCCTAGWIGVHCEKDTTPCDPSPCENGQCTETADYGYSCDCEYGYAGKNCERVITVCKGVDCSQRGSCRIKSETERTCECDQGYSGSDCHLLEGSCEKVHCYNGGECTNVETGHKCKCSSDFTGQRCETRIGVTCDGVLCSGHGTCKVENNQRVCNCQTGFTGDSCQFRACILSCKSGGSTLPKLGTGVWFCLLGLLLTIFGQN